MADTPATSRGLSARWRVVFIGVVVLTNLPLLALAFRTSAPTTVSVVPGGFTDDFDRTELGLNYFATGGYWRLVNGELLSPGPKHNPLWLEAALPDDVQIEFDARPVNPEGGVQCELFGDGYIHASGYLLTLENRLAALSRLDDRGVLVPPAFPSPLPDGGRVRVERRGVVLEPGRTYHLLIRRQGPRLTWQLDGQTLFDITDPEPLHGRGHDRFAFGGWDSDVFFDNLKITPFPSGGLASPAPPDPSRASGR